MENKIISTIAQKLFMISSLLIGIAGIGNLAMSQIHIKVITKVFLPEVGFYYFLFILFGIVSVMNTMNIRKKTANSGNAILMAIFGALATIVGYVYIQMILDDVSTSSLLTFEDVSLTIYVSMASCIIYGLGTLILLATNKEAKSVM